MKSIPVFGDDADSNSYGCHSGHSFAYLRYKNRPIKFAALKMLFIFASIALNIVYFVFMKGNWCRCGFSDQSDLYIVGDGLPDIWVAWFPAIRSTNSDLVTDVSLFLPILILGIAGILNQVVDKIIFPFVYPDEAERPYSWEYMVQQVK